MQEALSALELKTEGLLILGQVENRLDVGDSESHAEDLARAARLLAQAYQEGHKEPDVVWKLKQLWTDTGHLDDVITLLKDYLLATPDAEERFLAGHFIVDTYALMSERGDPTANELAVEHHRKCMDEFGPMVSPVRRLWSYSDGTMMRAWLNTGNIGEWIARSLAIYETITPCEEESRRVIAFYLRTLSFVCQGGPDEAITIEQRIVDLYKNDESAEGHWLVGNALGRLYTLYASVTKERLRDQAKFNAMALVRRIQAKYKDLVTEETSEAEAYRENGHMLCHDLGCTFTWAGDIEDGIAMFERALEFKENALTRYFYAGALLEGRGDRDEALRNLSKAASDPRSTLIHRFEQEFRGNQSFARVHDDAEFLAVVREAMLRYSQK